MDGLYVRKGVIVCTHENNKNTWLKDCLKSLKGIDIDIYTNTNENNHYEGGAIIYGYENYDEFWIIPDTVIVKDTAKLLECLDDTGTSYSAGPWFISCVAKLRREVLDKIGICDPPNSKKEAIFVEIKYLREVYQNAEPNHIVLDNAFNDGDLFEDKHGRTNMLLESDTFKKYKGTWHMEGLS